MNLKIEASSIVILSMYLIIFFSKERFWRWGFPFVKIRGFPNCPPATSQIGNSLSKTSVIFTECCSSDEPLQIFFHVSFFVIVCLYHGECNWLISKKTIVIKIMCKLSFNLLNFEGLVLLSP